MKVRSQSSRHIIRVFSHMPIKSIISIFWIHFMKFFNISYT